jgi:GNAT superfamily N-acetyltransferase
MGDIEHLAIVQLDTSDAAGGLALSTEARWNQNEADWHFFLSKGIVFGVRERNGRLAATSALLPYSDSAAWISMVLVTQSWRRRGLATRLVDTCMNSANNLGLTIWLDATAEGAAVYGPLGFAPTLQLRRLRLEQTPTAAGGPASRAGQLSEFITCDISAMGFDRRELLGVLAARSGSKLLSNGDAMALIRDGRTARHLGPLFADTPASALGMVRDIIASESGPILIDVVATQNAFLRGLTDTGWTLERSFQRMRFGCARREATELPFAVVGPEYG